MSRCEAYVTPPGKSRSRCDQQAGYMVGERLLCRGHAIVVSQLFRQRARPLHIKP